MNKNLWTTVMGIAGALVAGLALAAGTMHVNTRGGFAQAFWGDELSGGNVWVSQAPDGAYLNFSLYRNLPNPEYPGCLAVEPPAPPLCAPGLKCKRPPVPVCDPYVTYSAYGSAQIPSGDFTTTRTGAHLATDLASNPTAWLDGNIPGLVLGRVDFDWSMTRQMARRGHNQYDETYGGVSRHFNGRFTEFSAAMLGSLLGAAVSADGSYGENHGTDLCVSRGPVDECSPQQPEPVPAPIP